MLLHLYTLSQVTGEQPCALTHTHKLALTAQCFGDHSLKDMLRAGGTMGLGIGLTTGASSWLSGQYGEKGVSSI